MQKLKSLLKIFDSFMYFLYFGGSYAKRERNSSSTHARSVGIHDLERSLEPKVGCLKPLKLFCEIPYVTINEAEI